jgi:hypothetical protein
MSLSQTQLLLAKYGNPAASKAAEAEFTKKFMVLYNFPEWLLPHWPKYLKQGVKRQWLNKDVIAPLEAVFRELIATGLVKELKTYDGAWNIRKMRNSDQPSAHSWGLAFDFNASTNGLGKKWTPGQHGMFSKAFVDVWKKHGFMAGADFPQNDVMHYQLALPQPPAPKPAAPVKPK